MPTSQLPQRQIDSPAAFLGQRLNVRFEKARSRTRGPSHDLIGIPDWLIECKESDCPRVKGWWTALLYVAVPQDLKPALIYHYPRRDWRVVIAVRDVLPEFSQASPHWTIETDLEVFSAILERRTSRVRPT